MNYHKLDMNLSKIFLSFCECLGTFSGFPKRREFFQAFLFFFLSGAVFYFLISTIRQFYNSFIGICNPDAMNIGICNAN